MNEILSEYKYDENFTPSVPMREFKYHTIEKNERYPVYPYRTIIGKLLFLVNNTRLDIAFAVGYLARHQINPQPIHHKLISHLLSYLACHRNLGLLYCRASKKKSNPIELYADADFASESNRRSTTGYLLRYYNSTIHWTSRLQSNIAESSAEAELCSLTTGAHDALFVIRLQEDLLNISEKPFTGYEDNTATYNNCVALASPTRLKHVETEFFKSQEYVRRGLMELKLVGTSQQLADILTKPVPPISFTPMCNQLMFEKD